MEVKNNWKPCILCGGEIMQVREAFFRCVNCRQDYIADLNDMKLKETAD